MKHNLTLLDFLGVRENYNFSVGPDVAIFRVIPGNNTRGVKLLFECRVNYLLLSACGFSALSRT